MKKIGDHMTPHFCRSCGVEHWVPGILIEEAKMAAPERKVFCPNGHALHYGRRQEDVLKENLANRDARISRLVEGQIRLERINAALRGVVTKYKKKASRQ